MMDMETEPTVARAYVEDDDGSEHKIDLIADKITERVIVGMDGRYPIPTEMFTQLRHAYDNNRAALDEIFGTGNGRMD